MREVEDSPNRCPECQRVQQSAQLCSECLLKTTIVPTEIFIRSSHDQDLLDILEILLVLADIHPKQIRLKQMITSMRDEVSQRRAG